MQLSVFELISIDRMKLILSLFLHHHSHGRNLGLRGRLVRAQVVDQTIAQVVAQTVAQVILPVGSVFLFVMTTVVVDFILLTYGDALGENQGYSAQRSS
jgi:hypothetical protein